VEENIKHCQGEELDAITGFLPSGSLSKLLLEKWVERQLPLVQSSWIICQAATLGEDGKNIGSCTNESS
jgi:hypothetical protein